MPEFCSCSVILLAASLASTRFMTDHYQMHARNLHAPFASLFVKDSGSYLCFLGCI